MARVLTYRQEDFDLGFEPDYLFYNETESRYCAVKDKTIYFINFIPSPISPVTQLYREIADVANPKGWYYNENNNCIYFMDFDVEITPPKYYCCKYNLTTNELIKSDINLVTAIRIVDLISTCAASAENKIYYTIANKEEIYGVPQIVVQDIVSGLFTTKYGTNNTPLSSGYYDGTIYSLGYLNYNAGVTISKSNTHAVEFFYTDSSVSIVNRASSNLIDENIEYYTYISDGIDQYFINRNRETNILKLEYTNAYNLISTDIAVVAPSYSNIIKFEGTERYFWFTEGKINYLEFEEYNAKLKIYNNSGSIQRFSTEDKAPINKIFVRYLNGTDVAYFDVACVGGGSNNFTFNYNLDLPEDKTLIGYAYTPNSIYYDIPILTTVDIDNNEDLVVYEVLGDYRPLREGLKINLYQNTGERNRVNKTNYLTNVGEIFGVFREETSITNLTITIQIDTQPTFNYCFIEKFNRYYYVNDIRSLRNNLWEVDLSVDVLMTYRTAIGECAGFISRNQYRYNQDIIDKKRVVEQGYDYDIIPINNILFEEPNDYTGYSYVLNSFTGEVRT